MIREVTGSLARVCLAIIPDRPLAAKYNYDAHGSMTTMPHLSLLELDFKDQLCHVNLGGGGDAYYNYDSGSQRVRKVWEKSPGFIEERIYLGGFEIYRRKNGNGDITLERETLHVVDGNRVIALVETKTIDTTVPAQTLPSALVRYQFSNHLGSSSLELDEHRVITFHMRNTIPTAALHTRRAGVWRR